MVLKNTGDYLHRDDLQKKLREVYPKRASELAEVADRWNSYADREKAEMNILADIVAKGRTPAAARKKLTDYREAFARAGVSMVYLPDDVDGFFDLQAAQRDLQLELNATPLTNPKRRTELMQAFFGAAGEGLYLECPVYANWGCNTYWGERCYANFNLTLVATGHPVRPDLRYQGAQYSLPVHIGENVWIGANVTVLPGVTIGDNAVIGANSLVTKDIPANTVAYGSPCKVIREINERDDVYYWRDRQFSERFKLKEQ